MTAQEASGFLEKLALAYPAQYARLGAAELKGQIELWSGTMEGYSLEQAVVGLRVFLRGDTKGFAPVPGQVIDCIERVQRPAEDGYTNTECISLIRRAIGDALYHAEEAFERLPELCRRAVGTPRNLTEWAQLDSREVETGHPLPGSYAGPDARGCKTAAERPRGATSSGQGRAAVRGGEARAGAGTTGASRAAALRCPSGRRHAPQPRGSHERGENRGRREKPRRSGSRTPEDARTRRVGSDTPKRDMMAQTAQRVLRAARAGQNGTERQKTRKCVPRGYKGLKRIVAHHRA